MSEFGPNLYNPASFVNRDREIDAAKGGIDRFKKDRNQPRAMLFMGVRYVGKTWFSLHLARTIIPEMRIPTFFISLLKVHEGGEPGPGEWWLESEIEDDEQRLAALSDLLDKMACYWGTTDVKAGGLDDKSKYIQRDISELSESKTLVLIIDSAHESQKNLFDLLQRYVITPLTHTNRVFTIITGRGTPPTWDSPYLRTANSAQIIPFETDDVGKQLKISRLRHRKEESYQIAEISGGYPGTVRLLAESAENDPYDAIPGVLEKLLEDVPPTYWNIVYRYLERICVFKRPFRVSEAEALLERFTGEKLVPEDVKEAHDTLIDIHLMEWRSGGYELNESIKIPLQKYLQRKEHAAWKTYRNTAIELFSDLSKRYSREGYIDAVTHYQNLAQELINEEGNNE